MFHWWNIYYITYQQKNLKSTSQSPILRSFSNLPCSILQLPSRPSSSQGFVPRRAHHGWTYRPIFKHHQVILWIVCFFYHLSTGAGWTATIHDISSLLMSLAWFEGASPSRPTTFGWTHEPTPRHIHPGGGSCAAHLWSTYQTYMNQWYVTISVGFVSKLLDTHPKWKKSWQFSYIRNIRIKIHWPLDFQRSWTNLYQSHLRAL
jgi:hypothetical protein